VTEKKQAAYLPLHSYAFGIQLTGEGNLSAELAGRTPVRVLSDNRDL